MNLAQKIAEKIKAVGDAQFHQNIRGAVTADFPIKIDNQMYNEMLNRTDMTGFQKFICRIFKQETTLSVDYNGKTNLKVADFNVKLKQNEQETLQGTIGSSVALYINDNVDKVQRETAKNLFQDMKISEDVRPYPHNLISEDIQPYSSIRGLCTPVELNEQAKQALRGRIGQRDDNFFEKSKIIMCIRNDEGRLNVLLSFEGENGENTPAFLNENENNYLRKKAEEFINEHRSASAKESKHDKETECNVQQEIKHEVIEQNHVEGKVQNYKQQESIELD